MGIDRARFTPNGVNPDCPVPFGPNQTVPTHQMAELLADAVGFVDSVLEIGTGSGYQAAVLAERCGEVVSIEVQPPQETAKNLPANVTLIRTDGCVYDTGEQFDAVIVTFAAHKVYPVWIKQVREGGRLILPMECRGVCSISVYEKVNGRLEFRDIKGYAPFTEQVTQ